MSILFVDDDPSILEIARSCFSRHGTLKVATALSGREALEILQKTTFDAIVSDDQMSGMDGIALLQEIRSSGRTIPFIVYAGREGEDTVIRALNGGADYYLRKGGDLEAQLTDLAAEIPTIIEKIRKGVPRYADQELFESVLSNIQDVYFRIDRNGSLVFASPGIKVLLGYDPVVKLEGKPIAEMILSWSGQDKDFVSEVKARGAVINRDLVLRNKDGLPVSVAITGHSSYDHDGAFAGIEGIFRDTTEIRRRENVLRQINRQHSLLTSITRHDILNQVTALKAYLSIAEIKEPGQEMKNCFARLNEATDKIQSQIIFTRTYENIGSKEPQWIHPSLIIQQLAVPPGIVMEDNVGGIEIYCDPMIAKVFLNLLDNSLKHGGHVTKIRVFPVVSGAGLVLVWEDDGVGIPATQKTAIFDRGVGKNSGMGLFLIREILSLTGITIQETGEPGRGARFELTVPPDAFREVIEKNSSPGRREYIEIHFPSDDSG